MCKIGTLHIPKFTDLCDYVRKYSSLTADRMKVCSY